jgi:hypothetical protein
MDLIPERKTETVWVPQTSITERGVLEIFPRRAAMEGALMGIGISRERPQFVPEGFQFVRVLRGKFFYGESRVDEHRIARLDITTRSVRISVRTAPAAARARCSPSIVSMVWGTARHMNTPPFPGYCTPE